MIDDRDEDLVTREDLVGFFQDLTDQPGFSFRGLRVEIDRVGVIGNLLIAFLVPQIFGLVARFSGAKLKKPGDYLRFVFPSTLAADLLLGSTKETKSERSSFEDCFYVDAADMDTVHAFLTDEMQRTLLELNRRYFVRMTDYYIEFGPILSRAEHCADDVMLLAKALPQLKVPDTEAFNDMDLPNTPFVVVKTVSSNVQANLLMLSLGSKGIPCRLLHGAQSAVWGNLGAGLGVQVSVPESFRDEAMEIITYKPVTS